MPDLPSPYILNLAQKVNVDTIIQTFTARTNLPAQLQRRKIPSIKKFDACSNQFLREMHV